MTWLEENKRYLEHLQYILSLEEANTSITIDGINVFTRVSFRLSKQWVKEKYDLFNKKYFNNKLENIDISKIFIVNESYFRGQTIPEVFKTKSGIIASYKVTRLELSEYYKLSEKEWCDILLHEMIHICLGDHLIEATGNHTEYFKRLMAIINNTGWNIETVAHFSYRNIYNNALKKLQNSIAVVWPDTKNNVFKMFVSNPKNINDIKEVNSDAIFFSIKNIEKFKDFPYVDNFKDNYEEGIPMLTKTVDEVDQLLAEFNKIDLKESIKEEAEELPPAIQDFLNSLYNTTVLSITKEEELFNGEEVYRIKMAQRD